jgi:intracellular sulfur oxidation DsrE/DsrF family protein
MKSTIILFTHNGIGSTPEDLGKTLVKNYLGLLKDEKKLPVALLFYGEGVKLVCEESPVLDSLAILEGKGVRLIACKTCLNYFGLMDNVKVGQIGTMADILTFQLEADKIISM